MTRTRFFAIVLAGGLAATHAGDASTPATRPVAVSPGSPTAITTVGDACPTFSWGGIASADAYDLAIWEIAGGAEVWAESTVAPVAQVRLPRGASSWTPSLARCLNPGRYGWTVRAVDASGTGDWSVPALFEVSTVPGPREVQRALGVLERYLGNDVPGDAHDAVQGSAVLSAIRRDEPLAARVGAPSSPYQSLPLSAETLGAGPIPATVFPGAYSLETEGDIGLGGALFQGGDSLLHADGGTAYENTGVGLRALNSAAPGPGGTYGRLGWGNTALGYTALTALTTGERNTAVGARALHLNSGSFNTAVGYSTLRANYSGSRNVGIGFNALLGGAGANNTAVGTLALFDLNTSSSNTAVGYRALRSLEFAGYSGGANNIALGALAGASLRQGQDNILIGADAGAALESATIRIGDGDQTKTFIAGVFGVAPDDGTREPVLVDSNGQLGTPPTTTASLTFSPDVNCDTEVATVTGANTGELVLLGPPTGFGSTHLLATAWVSAADEVTVRVCHGASGSLGTDANGSYRIAVIG